jgi:ferritin-like protein
MPITTRQSLHEHLQWALQIEHATIPPYLCALYSIPDRTNLEAAEIIRSVVMEEMLHLTLVANVLNAVGGAPVVAHPSFVPDYPAWLPHSSEAFKVSLLPLGEEALTTFLNIERPAKHHGRSQSDRYDTLGQFYQAVLDGISEVAESERQAGKNLFDGDPSRQVPTRWYYGGGGEVLPVTDLESARRAVLEIMEQGEGLNHTIFDGDDQFGETHEVAHYFRFDEIRTARRYQCGDTAKHGPTGAELPMDWSIIHPMHPNPKAREYVDQPAVHRLMVRFNRAYTALLRELHAAFNGTPGRLFHAVPLMYQLRYQAEALMKIPSRYGDGTTVGPSFEYDDSAATPI